MKQLLIPSRHILYSKEQYVFLDKHLQNNKYDCIIFVVTSSNLNNCKYSPVLLQYRIMMIDNLVFHLKKNHTFKYKVVCLPHYHQVDSFVDRLVKSVNVELVTGVNKETTDVYTFGVHIGSLFNAAGYTTFIQPGIDHTILFKELFEKNNKEYFDANISDGSKEVFTNQEEIIIQARKIWVDKILKESGSITDNRNYNSYAFGMSNSDMIEVKYNDVKEYIVEGRITDEGCADAALFVPVARDFPDSDLIGIDISNDFIARANENIRRGLFGGSFVSILQANLMEPIFDEASINTTICNSTMHEVWSYNNKYVSVQEYLALKYIQLVEGGRILIRDVIGPIEKNTVVYLRSLEDKDNEHFKKFVQDFKHLRKEDMVEGVLINSNLYHKTTLKLASEYLLHKDYQDNWESELNEEFCHFSIDDWKDILLAQNFKIVKLSSYRSDWITDNRYKNKVELFDENMHLIEFPETNVVIVAEK